MLCRRAVNAHLTVLTIELGGPTAAILVLHQPDIRVTIVDRDVKRIQAWKGRYLPIHDPGLEDVVRMARDGGVGELSNGQAQAGALDGVPMPCKRALVGACQPNLFFSTPCAQAIAQADMCLVSVNTTKKLRGTRAGQATDMTAFEAVCRDVATYAKAGAILLRRARYPAKLDSC